MPDTSVDRWPHVELVTFSAPTGIPFGWDNELVNKGVPKDLLGTYNAAHELTLLEVPDYGPLVCFSITGEDRLCQDPHTGAIVYIGYMPAGIVDLRPGFLVGPPGLVNSSLDQFIASVRAVVERFPFYNLDTGEGDDLDDPASARARAEQHDSEVDRAAEDLTEILRSIDRAAVADETTFWWSFVFDVQMGDFATEDVLRDRGQ
jgi:SUKH-4 immunity protein of toxin-antitoxin system